MKGATVRAGANASESILVLVRNGDVDLRGVDSARLEVKTPAGREVIWTAVMSRAGAEGVFARHTFDDLGQETKQTGEYRVMPILVREDTSEIRCYPFTLHVVDKWS